MLVLALIFGISLGSVSAQNILGYWKTEQKGGVILIYEEEGMYFGQVLLMDDPKKDAKLQEYEKVVLLRHFEKKSETEFCCGTIFHPKRQQFVKANMTLKDKNTLVITAKKGIFKKSKTWTKI